MGASIKADRGWCCGARESMRDKCWQSRAVLFKWLGKGCGEAGERTSSNCRLAGSETTLWDAHMDLQAAKVTPVASARLLGL